MVKEQNLFKDKEKVVVDIMMELYDMRSYIESEVYEANIKTAKRFLKMKKLSFEEIAVGSGLSVEKVEELAKEL